MPYCNRRLRDQCAMSAWGRKLLPVLTGGHESERGGSRRSVAGILGMKEVRSSDREIFLPSVCWHRRRQSALLRLPCALVGGPVPCSAHVNAREWSLPDRRSNTTTKQYELRHSSLPLLLLGKIFELNARVEELMAWAGWETMTSSTLKETRLMRCPRIPSTNSSETLSKVLSIRDTHKHRSNSSKRLR